MKERRHGLAALVSPAEQLPHLATTTSSRGQMGLPTLPVDMDASPSQSNRTLRVLGMATRCVSGAVAVQPSGQVAKTFSHGDKTTTTQATKTPRNKAPNHVQSSATTSPNNPPSTPASSVSQGSDHDRQRDREPCANTRLLGCQVPTSQADRARHCRRRGVMAARECDGGWG